MHDDLAGQARGSRRRLPLARARGHHFEDALAELRVALAIRGLRLLFPRITLGGLLGSQAGVAGARFEGDSETRLVAPGINWSFLDAGRVRARSALNGNAPYKALAGGWPQSLPVRESVAGRH